MSGQTVYLVWEEEMYEAPALCGIYDNLAAAKEHQARLRKRDNRYRRCFYRIDRARVATAFKRGVKWWPRREMLECKP